MEVTAGFFPLWIGGIIARYHAFPKKGKNAFLKATTHVLPYFSGAEKVIIFVIYADWLNPPFGGFFLSRKSILIKSRPAFLFIKKSYLDKRVNVVLSQYQIHCSAGNRVSSWARTKKIILETKTIIAKHFTKMRRAGREKKLLVSTLKTVEKEGKLLCARLAIILNNKATTNKFPNKNAGKFPRAFVDETRRRRLCWIIVSCMERRRKKKKKKSPNLFSTCMGRRRRRMS